MLKRTENTKSYRTKVKKCMVKHMFLRRLCSCGKQNGSYLLIYLMIKWFLPVVRRQKREQGKRRQLPPFRLSDIVHAIDPHFYHDAQQLVHLRKR